MEEYVVYHEGAACGTLQMEPRGLYTYFSVCCGARSGQLYTLLLDGERGSVPIGIPEWQDGCFVLRKSIANRHWQQIGAVQCARLTLRGDTSPAQDENWIALAHPEYFFRVLTPQLAQAETCYWRQTPEGRFLAVPMETGRPFLLPRYFCFAHVRSLWGKPYAVFFFDNNGKPRNFE